VKPRRYQLRKEAVGIVVGGHPWLFREQMSSAAQVFRDGDWLRLVDGSNRVIGHGIFEAQGAIAVRVLRTGHDAPDAAWLRGQLERAIARRAKLARTTDGMRLVNGESDGIPAVVVDRFGDVAVVASYSTGADGLARYVAHALRDVRSVIVRPARRRQGAPPPPRVLRGEPPAIAHFREDDLAFAVDLAAGHKTGAYLDLRGLRRAIRQAPLAGARVLNLFAYTGMLGRAAEAAGATHIVQVDQSERALAFAAQHHVGDSGTHRFITADVFEWFGTASFDDAFDLVIADPPAMTSRQSQVAGALAAYRKLFATAARHVRPGGALVTACCTSRIDRATFRRTAQAALGERFALERDIPAEIDHPVGFREADYLKILFWRCTSAAQ
jgi:23S rRNA (cytosine1962-C5)-methyltransferase